MKSFCAFSKVKITFFVIISIVFLNACTIERSASKKDFYSNRIVKKSDSRTFALKHNKVNYADISKVSSVSITETEKALDLTEIANQPIDYQQAIIPFEISKTSNKSPDLKTKAGIGSQIKNLYQQSKDVKTFKKEYKAIKEQRIEKFTNKKNIDDPLPTTKKSSNGLSIASFVLSIVGLVIFGLICGSLAIIFGAIALSKGKGLRGLAIAGLVIGIIDVAFVLIYMASLT